MANNILTPLGWDTDFFRFNVAQVIFERTDDQVFDLIFKKIREKRFRLTYLFVAPDEENLNTKILKAGGVLVDKKTLFSKTPQPHSEFRNDIIEYNGHEVNEKLISLAIEAGIYSRFRIDMNFQNDEFRRLYTIWIKNSVSRMLAFKVLVSVHMNNIVGLLTLGIKDNHADIGLVSVDPQFSGRGIGTDMVRYADSKSYEMKFNKIKVVTQFQNERACQLYRKCGFEIENITNVYHFWQW